MTFGSTTGSYRCCDIVHVKIGKGAHQSKEVTLHSVSSICESLTGPRTQYIIEKYPYLQELDLADSGMTNISHYQPQVLIGLDHYWDFMTGETIHINNGPVATRSTLGWVLSGPISGEDEETGQESALITHNLKVTVNDRNKDKTLE